MIRAGFFAMGVVLAFGGAALFPVDAVVLTEAASQSGAPGLAWISSTGAEGRRIVDPPDWVPFTLVGLGGVTILYSIALPKE